MKTIQEVVSKGIAFLSQKGIANSRRQVEEIIGDALNLKRLQLYLEFDRPLTEAEVDKCRALILRRSKGEPNQYLRGYTEFLDCTIKVTPDVLIPRQETELLADKIIQTLSQEELTGKIFWDVCCGSGCIGIAIKKKFPQLDVVLSDLSALALAVAKENSEINQVNLTFLQGDLLTPFNGKKTDYFVCNPPYISEAEFPTLDPEVREFEPQIALVAKEEGIEFYRRLSQDLPSYLNSSAKLWFEIGHDQGTRVQKLFFSPFWKKNEVERDWSGQDRFFFLEIE